MSFKSIFLGSQIDTAIGKAHTQGSDQALGTIGTKNPPIDADKAIYRDSTASDALVTSTWTQIKAFLKTYFDGLYLALSGGTLTGNLLLGNSARYLQNAGTWLTTVDSQSIFVVKGSGTDNIYFNIDAGRVVTFGTGQVASAGTTKYNSPLFNLQGKRWNGSASGVLNGQFYLDANATIDNSFIAFGFSDNTNQMFNIRHNGCIGIKTTAPDKQLEINSANGNNLRLTYNDSNGSAAYYVDFLVSSAGLLTITASGGIINTANDIEITDTTKGIILKSPDGSRFRVTVNNDGALITTSI